MMPISTKLNLLILALPISSLILVFFVGFYFYRESFDAQAFSTAVSSLTSAILVILLVWERLRDSLFKKLEYMHKDFLSKLYFELPQRLFYSKNSIIQLKSDLEKYAKFLGLGLYPHNFLKEIDSFLFFYNEFFTRYKTIEEKANLARKQLHPNDTSFFISDFFQDFLGFKPEYRGHGNTEEENFYRELAQMSINENPKLVSEMMASYEKTRNLQNLIMDRLVDFLKSNSLGLEAKPYGYS